MEKLFSKGIEILGLAVNYSWQHQKEKYT